MIGIGIVMSCRNKGISDIDKVKNGNDIIASKSITLQINLLVSIKLLNFNKPNFPAKNNVNWKHFFRNFNLFVYAL